MITRYNFLTGLLAVVLAFAILIFAGVSGTGLYMSVVPLALLLRILGHHLKHVPMAVLEILGEMVD